MGDRCTGHCCRAFCLSPLYAMRLNSGDEEARQVSEMIRPLLPGSWLGGQERVMTEEEQGHYYTCTHLTPSGDCGIYESRPAMCSAYPYGKRCGYPGCTWDEARSLPSDTELTVEEPTATAEGKEDVPPC